MTTSTGASSSGYGFTGEYQQNSLVYLRARHYAPGMGRFLTRDTWPNQNNLYRLLSRLLDYSVVKMLQKSSNAHRLCTARYG